MTPKAKKNAENVEEKTEMIPEEAAEAKSEQPKKRKCGRKPKAKVEEEPAVEQEEIERICDDDDNGGDDCGHDDLKLSDEDLEELKKVFGDLDLPEVPVKEMMINAYREAFDNNELRYEYKEEDDVILTGFALDCKLGNVKFVIRFGEDDVSIRCYAPLKATEDVRPAVMEYITRANYGLRDGAFEMDLSDGEIVYRTYVNCEDLICVPECVVLNSVGICNRMMERYGNGLAAILMGFSDPVTEIEKAENADD